MSQKSRNKLSRGPNKYRTPKSQVKPYMSPTELESVQPGHSAFCTRMLELNWPSGSSGGNKATATPGVKQWSDCAARRRKSRSTSKGRENLVKTMLNTLQEPPEAVKQKVPEVQNVNGKDSTGAAVLKCTELSRDDIEKKIKALMDESLRTRNLEEVTVLTSPNTMPVLITKAIKENLERSSQARCFFGHLLHDLLEYKIMTIDQYNKGFHPVLEWLDDYALDIPKIWEYLGEIIEPMIEDYGSDPNFLKDLLQPCIHSDVAGRLLSAVLHCAASKLGTIKVRKIWKKSGLKWEDFLLLGTNVSIFVASNKLEFTVTPMLEELTSAEIKKQIKKQINFMLTSNASSQYIFDFVEPSHAGLVRSQPDWNSKQKKIIPFSSSLNQAVKLHKFKYAWKPSAYRAGTDAGELVRTEDLYKKVRGILNKLTPQKFERLVKQVKNLDINTEERLKGVVDLVFERAVSEPLFSVPYANMCKQLALVKVPLSKGEGCVNFRKLLLIKCQREFEQGRSDELNRVEKKKQIEECKVAAKVKQLQEEYDKEEQKNRRRQLGNIRFIGELFKLGMLIEPIIHECIQKLLNQGDEDSLECLCRLLTTIGQKLVSKKERESDDFESKKLRNWVPRRKENNPKTIAQIHKEAEKEAQEEQQLLQSKAFSKRPSATALECTELSRDDSGKKVKPIMDEFLCKSDFEAATKCIMKLAFPNTMAILITEAINKVLEQSSQSRCLFGQLLRDLLKSKIMTIDHYNKGFHLVLEFVDDYALDIPKIWEYLSEIIEPMIEGHGSNLSFLKDFLQPCIKSDAAGMLLSAVLHCAASKHGFIKVGKMWRESGLQWTDFLPSDTNVSKFIASNKLEFTVKSQPSAVLSSEEIKKQINFMLTSEASNEDIFNWVERNIGEESMFKPAFVRDLVTSILEHVISVTGESSSVDSNKVERRFSLIRCYVVEKYDLQLQTLYAAQAVANKLNHPKGLLKQLFDHFYDMDIITEESYEKWKNSTVAAEQEGKSVALVSVSSFFVWLKEFLDWLFNLIRMD